MKALKTAHAIYGEVGHLTTVGMKHMNSECGASRERLLRGGQSSGESSSGLGVREESALRTRDAH